MFISSNEEMSSDYKGETENMEDADFAMKKELEGAEAAVEECYRRRARKAELEGVLSVGRFMSEGELDALSELLGDETGSRAKRRREVEEMTIEEMEAELGEVKRRSGRGGGQVRNGYH